ncbi:MAG: carbohydrate ABC transporter permease, partial [Candidatus Ratteibacteria bacterium]|nr:carbohydrate ABC transporter permease [Candidatus Ratteibacteria bacterium]
MKISLEYKIKSFLNQLGIQIILLVVAIACLFPLVWTLSASLKTNQTIFEDMSLIPRQFNFINYYIAWTKGHFGTYFFNSILYTVVVVAGIVIIGSMAAYALARLKFPGRNFFFFLLIATMLIPVPGAIIALYLLLMKLGLANTRIGYILPLINGGLPLAIFLFKTFFERIPEDLEDAARIDGCSKFGIYWRVALPLARPAIAVVVIFNSLTVWNEYILAM